MMIDRSTNMVFPKRHLIQKALSAGALTPKFSIVESVEAVRALGGRRAAVLFRRHKVRSLIAKRFAPFGGEAAIQECLSDLEDDLVALRQRHRELPELLDELA